jgi:hypothetical protein
MVEGKSSRARFTGLTFTLFGFAALIGGAMVEPLASEIGFFFGGRPRERFVGDKAAGTLKGCTTSGSVLIVTWGIETEGIA